MVGGQVWGTLTLLAEEDRKWQTDEMGFSAEEPCKRRSPGRCNLLLNYADLQNFQTIGLGL